METKNKISYVPPRNPLGILALQIALGIHGPRGAAPQLRLDPIPANVKFLTVLGMGVGRVRKGPVVVPKDLPVRAGKPVGQFFYGFY